MARLFISHSSANNAAALALCKWLSEQGFEDVFLDIDPDRGLVAGAIYGIALLVVHGALGTHAKVSLGSFPPLLAVVTAIAGMLLSALGGRIARMRRERRTASDGAE